MGNAKNSNTASARREPEYAAKDGTVLDALSSAEETLLHADELTRNAGQQVFTDLREISEQITATKKDLLAVDIINPQRVPEAGFELGEVVKATEQATNTIMEQAESLLSVETDCLESYREAVEAAVTQIFEACSFQDITGQRIGKVVDTLNYIQSRIDRINDTLGLHFSEAAAQEDETERRRRELLLHGPADEEADGVASQDDIDALFD